MRRPRATICIPHWQVRELISMCLRSIRKHSAKYDLEVMVVDNGSRDASLEYLRSLRWIRLIEHPEETHTNWPGNVMTAWDRGVREALGEYFVTMHSDVFIKADDWLDPFLERMDGQREVAGAGAWKLEIENPLYKCQKLIIGNAVSAVRNLFGAGKSIAWRRDDYPRDYCAMYRRDVILEHDLTFRIDGGRGGGHAIAKRLWDAGYETRMIPVRDLDARMVHIAHGTAGVAAGKPLPRRRAQARVARRVRRLFAQDWVRALEGDVSLDA